MEKMESENNTNDKLIIRQAKQSIRIEMHLSYKMKKELKKLKSVRS